MSYTTLDRISVSQLPDRYSITRSVVYNRLNDLKIKPERQGNKAYVNAQQLDLLDRLHQHIQQGGITADFLATLEPSARASAIPSGLQSAGQSARASGLQSAEPSARASGLQSAGQMLVDAQTLTVLGEMVARSLPAPDPFINLRLLQEACDRGWLLSTSQLAPLLGVKSLNGQVVERYGFRFTRVGKNGIESAWRIEQQ
jgi:hypothetical protein